MYRVAFAEASVGEGSEVSYLLWVTPNIGFCEGLWTRIEQPTRVQSKSMVVAECDVDLLPLVAKLNRLHVLRQPLTCGEC